MASLVLGVAGAAAGGAFLPAVPVLGLSGAALGGAAGALAGSFADRALLGRPVKQHQRLGDLHVQASQPGAPIPRVYGRVRVAGQVIWAAQFTEIRTEEVQGGKGGGGVEVVGHSYTANFAVALCEGPITRIGRIWADGKPLSAEGLTLRVHLGAEDQAPDPLITAIEGSGEAPAYRGTAYVVFEDLPLEPFGNRVPQLSFEVVRQVGASERLETLVTAVDIIPGSGEFVYATDKVFSDLGNGASRPVTINNALGLPDLEVSLDQLTADLPNTGAAGLVVSWFGTDLRCGQCEVRPAAESADRATVGGDWSVGGLGRSQVAIVSQADGTPVYGGTPSDASVVQAIQSLKARGLSVMFYPFILMDIPAGNGLDNPYAPGSEQEAFPWRGRITLSKAPNDTESPDQTAGAADEVSAFFGQATAGEFSVNGTTVTYHGADGWTFRRYILHYAHLCQAAGGVDRFLIGSEMRGLTQIRSGPGVFPAVTQFRALAGEVRSILGPSVQISYAADWSEYFGYQPPDGSGDVYFHLDPLWADSDIDFIGIDHYFPLADWRDGSAHLDAGEAVSDTDFAYLQRNIEGGERYDWFYASSADREAQLRTPITDGAYDEPWVFRPKDLRNWWSSSHYDRPGGVRSATPTAWVPEAKPICLTELGCPAVDKGANGPNVFYDPKSSESAFPPFSTGRQDDLIQRRYLEAVIGYWSDPAMNPVSGLYAGPMVESDIFVWTWDARPFPDFPLRTDVWADGGNYRLGHWLNGRAGKVPLADILIELTALVGLGDVDVAAVRPLVTGFLIDQVVPPRTPASALVSAYDLDVRERGGVLTFSHPDPAVHAVFTADDLAEASPAGGARGDGIFSITRRQTIDLPSEVVLQCTHAYGDYQALTAASRRIESGSAAVETIQTALVLAEDEALDIADRRLMGLWSGREDVSFMLPPSGLALEPGDWCVLQTEERAIQLRIGRVEDGFGRAVTAQSVQTDQITSPDRSATLPGLPLPVVPGPVHLEILDLPQLRESDPAHAPYLAATATPWPGRIRVTRTLDGAPPRFTAELIQPAVIGETLTAFAAGPVWRWDRANQLDVRLFGGALQSVDPSAVLSGSNLLALETGQGQWELLQFQTAVLIGPNTYRLSQFLRGQLGTETDMAVSLAAGARAVILNGSVLPAEITLEERELAADWTYGPPGLPVTDPAIRSRQYTPSARGLKPLSPVHLRARRIGGSGDIEVTWVRRARQGGDSWSGSDVPFTDLPLVFEVDILDGASSHRTLTVTEQRAVYLRTDQVSDFGSEPLSAFDVRIAQVSAEVGRGMAAQATLAV